MLEAHSLVKKFNANQKPVLSDCSFSVNSGELAVLIGDNGVGKTTLFDIISGLIKPDRGGVFLDGKRINGKSAYKISKSGIQRSFQEAELFGNLTVIDHLLLVKNKLDTCLGCNFINLKEEEQELEAILNFFDIEHKKKALVSNLSYGQRKIVNLAMSLIFPHKFLLLDELLAGVGPKYRRKIKQILAKEKERNKGVILIAHDLSLIEDLVDKKLYLKNGKIV